MRTKKSILIIALLAVCMLIQLTSCQKEPLPRPDSENQYPGPPEGGDGWPNGMVHLNEIDSVQ